MRNWRNTPNQFGTIAKLIHWTMAAGIIGMLVLGFVMKSLPPSPVKWEVYYVIHKSIGVVLLGLLAFRLVWRLSNPKPIVTVQGRLKIFARLSVYVLYAIMFVMIISGYIMSDAGNHPIRLFNKISLPLIFPTNAELSSFALKMHTITAYSLVGIIAVHMLASLYHHFILKDAVLVRMLPNRRVKK